MELQQLALVFAIGFIAAYLGSIVGGGGLIAIPGLLWVGIPAQSAVIIDLSGVVGATVAGWYPFHQAEAIDYRVGARTAVVATFGAVAGAGTLVSISNPLLESLLSAVLLVIAISMLLQRQNGGQMELVVSKYRALVGYSLFGFVGFWGALFSAGFGVLSCMVLSRCFGKTLLNSAGTARISALCIALTSIAMVGLQVSINWPSVTAFVAGQIIGGFAGAKHAVMRGESWIRALIVVIAVSICIRTLLRLL